MGWVGSMKMTSTYNPLYRPLDSEVGISCSLQQVSVKSWVPWSFWSRHEQIRTWLYPWAGHLFYILQLMCSDPCFVILRAAGDNPMEQNLYILMQHAAESPFTFRLALLWHKVWRCTWNAWDTCSKLLGQKYLNIYFLSPVPNARFYRSLIRVADYYI